MGKRKLISKDNIREAIGHSPDEADALALSCAYAGDLQVRPAPQGFSDNDNLRRQLASVAGWNPGG
jgi:hypothetical protein